MFGFSKTLTMFGVVGIVLALVMAGVGGIYHTGRTAEHQILQPKIDLLNAIIATDETTIAMLQADAKTNDALLAQYTDAIDLLTKKTFDDLNAIRRLEANDQLVSTYLHTPIPDALRRLLNNEPADPAPGDQISLPVAAPGPRPNLPATARR